MHSTDSCVIGKDYLKHLTDVEYFRYVLREHTCLGAKYTRCIFKFHHWRETANANQGIMRKPRYFRMRPPH